jgi:ssDNA-binding Zn-finger/Zn-ribbon topoisomerase 1
MADVRCPKCGGETVILTSKKDDRQYHVCVNRSKCRGRVPVGDDEHEDRKRESLAAVPRRDSLRQRRAPHHITGGASIDEAWAGAGKDDWGDDWDDEGGPPKAAPYLPQYPKAQRRAAAEREEPPGSRRRREHPHAKHAAGSAVRKPDADERDSAMDDERPARKRKVPPDSSWGDDWGDEVSERKTAPERPPRAELKKKAFLKDEESREPERQRIPDAADKKPRPRKVLKKEAPPEKKKTASRWRGWIKGKPAHKKGKASDTRRQRTRQAEIASGPKEASGFEERSMQKEAESDSKRRNMIVFIVVLVVALLAIGGIIYAAVGL